jgi:hypothetical protein
MSERAKAFIILLIAAGFEVYTNDHRAKIRWYYFVRDNKIGYFQENDYVGFSFTSVHNPCRECGTGFRIRGEVDNPTISLAEETANMFCWPGYENVVKKYSGWEEFTRKTYGSNKFIKIIPE